MADQKTLLERAIETLQNHPVIAGLILLGAIVIALAKFRNALRDLFSPIAPDSKSVEPETVVNIVEALQSQYHQQLDDAAEREEGLREQNRHLIEAVQALAAQRGAPDAPPGVDEAYALLAKGRTDAAEMIFEEVKERRKAEGTAAHKEAAAAARNLGALAFLHDTEKALAAYQEAVELDPEELNGWNQLGHLLFRVGDLQGAVGAYNRVLQLGKKAADQERIAAATGNLGIVYQTLGDLDRAEETQRKSLELHEALGLKEGMARNYGNLGVIYEARGDLNRAEEMQRKSLDLNEALGRKEGMANSYDNLGIVYQTRGDLDRAEEMHRKSLELNEGLGGKVGMASNYGNLGNVYRNRGDLDRAEEMYGKSLELNETLGRKDGMARDYGNLGIVYRTRGDLDRAEEMYRKSLSLFREVGAAPGIEQAEELLKDLRAEQQQ